MTQEEALEILKKGNSAFITGPAGSGKTFLLNSYINFLRRNNIGAAVTASTGIAATHLGGMTVHAWSGLGIKDALSEGDVNELKDRNYLKMRYRKTNVLIIDEISMLNSSQLDMVDRLFRAFKESDAPFGGVQVVLCGDFFQLPPVVRIGENRKKFAYASRAWQNSGLKICYLDEQHRQSDDLFLSVLNAIRNDSVGGKERACLESRMGCEIGGRTQPTKLYTHNADVDLENSQELRNISGKEYLYRMEGRGKEGILETIKRGCLAPEVLHLKVGARVMFVKNNFDEGYSNGTLGTVKSLDSENILVRTKAGRNIDVKLATWAIEEDGRVKAQISQYPLRLAWAITVHKSQGMSLDAARVDLSQSFERGMGYVALSRVRSLDGLSLAGFNENALKVSDEVLVFDRELKKESEKHAAQIRAAMAASPREKNLDEPAAKLKTPKKMSTSQQTKQMIEKRMELEDIAKARKLTVGTILTHLEKLKEEKQLPDISYLGENIGHRRLVGMQRVIFANRDEDGKFPLFPVKEIFGDDVSYEELRLARLLMDRLFE